MDSCLVSIQTIGATPFAFMEALHPGYRHGGTCFKNCCNQAILQAFGRDAGYITWSADAIWSNSAGRKIEQALNANKRALMYVGYRMEAALDGPFVSLLEARRSGSTINVDPLSMCKAYLEESGVGSMPSSIIEPDFGKNPSNLRWSTGDGRGMLVRAMHVNVGFIHAEKGPVNCAHGTDHELAEGALTDPDKAMLVTDATEHLVMGFDLLGTSGPPKPEGRVPVFPPYSRTLVAIYLKILTFRWARHWITIPWWLHDGTVEPNDPMRIEAEHKSNIEVICILKELRRLTKTMTNAEQKEEHKMRVWDY